MGRTSREKSGPRPVVTPTDAKTSARAAPRRQPDKQHLPQATRIASTTLYSTLFRGRRERSSKLEACRAAKMRADATRRRGSSRFLWCRLFLLRLHASLDLRGRNVFDVRGDV